MKANTAKNGGGANGSEIIAAVGELAKEKGISKDLLFDAIEAALVTAYRKNLPRTEVEPATIVPSINREDGSIHIYARLLVVEEVENPAA